MSKPRRFLAFSCVHAPDHDPESITWIADQVRDIKPDVIVCLGDLFDAAAASVHRRDFGDKLIDEYEAGAAVLEEISEAAPGAELHWTLGNHDDNIKAKGRISKELRCLLDWNGFDKPWSATFRRWKQYPYEQTHRAPFRVGQVTFYHGWATSKTQIAGEALRYGDECGLVVNGHTHRPHDVERVEVYQQPQRRWLANAGCHVSMQYPMDYVARKNWSKWGNACIVGEALPLKSPRKSINWSAETRIRCMAGTDSTDLRPAAFAA